jgi:hypothetical protein
MPINTINYTYLPVYVKRLVRQCDVGQIHKGKTWRVCSLFENGRQTVYVTRVWANGAHKGRAREWCEILGAPLFTLTSKAQKKEIKNNNGMQP